MRKFSYLLVISLLSILPCAEAHSQDSWSTEQLHVLASMQRLSESTASDGGGADKYGEVLAENFSRWTTGSKVINHKDEWIEGVRSWFDDGWRVIDRSQTILEITIRGDEAFTRRLVEETYFGPDEEQTLSKAALAETWVRSDDRWFLLRVNVDVLDSQ